MKPAIVKIGDEYFIEYYAQGLKFQKKGGRDYNHAQKILAQIEASLPKDITKLYAPPEHSAFELIDAFLKFAQKEFPPKSFARYQSAVRHFQDFIRHKYGEGVKVQDVTHSTIEFYRLDLITSRQKPKLINFTLFLMRDMFDYAIKERFLNDNPVLHIKLFDCAFYKSLRILIADEQKRFFVLVPEDYRIIFECMLYAGLRVEEVWPLRWSDIDFSQNYLRIQFLNQAQGRNIPLDPVLRASLVALKSSSVKEEALILESLNSRPTKDDLMLFLRRICEENHFSLGINILTFRHTFAANMVKRGVRLRDLCVLLGLDDIAKVWRYSSF